MSSAALISNVLTHCLCPPPQLEQAPKTSKISYTILSTSHLMSTPLLHQGKLLKEEGKFVVASYGMGVNYCSPNVSICLSKFGRRLDAGFSECPLRV